MGEARSALIVATYAYDDAAGLTTLRAPQQDAEALGAVLADPDIGGFDVRTVVNQPAHIVNLEVARFFADRKPDELLLLHFSCHGVKDDSGELFFATTDTRLDVLEATAISAAFVNRAMTRSRSSRVVLLLDCCYAGAFARGMTSRGGPGLDLGERLAGKGRAVITASSALQFAFEDGDLATGDPDRQRPSVFTRSLVEGLSTGDADRDLDGLVSLDELYHYVYDRVTAASPHQTPSKWVFGLEGDLFLARRGMPVSTPSPLPPEIVESMSSSVAWQREAVVPELGRVLHGSHPGRALAARQALERLSDDDSRKVALCAVAVLAGTVPQQRLPLSGGTGPSGSSTAPRHATAGDPASRPHVDPAGAGRDRSADPPTTVMPVVTRVLPANLARRRIVLVAACSGLLLAGLAWWLVARGSAGGNGAAPSEADVRLGDGIVVVSKTVGGVATLTAFDVEKDALLTSEVAIPGRLPSISPDRRWVVYLGGNEAVHLHGTKFIPYRVRADGSRARRLLPRGLPHCPYAGRVAWNPRGHDQLLVPCRDGTKLTGELRRVSLDGKALDETISAPGIVGDPTWTGDGHIVYARRFTDGHTELWQVSVDKTSTNEQLVPPDPGSSDFDPDWSPSGGLVFVRSTTSGAPGRLMTRQDDATRAVGVSVNVLHPAWSPDGRSVAFIEGTGTRGTLWTRSADGSAGPTSLTGTDGAPAWGSR